MAHYTAFRRGPFERRLMADLFHSHGDPYNAIKDGRRPDADKRPCPYWNSLDLALTHSRPFLIRADVATAAELRP